MANIFNRRLYNSKGVLEHKRLSKMSEQELLKIAKERGVTIKKDSSKLEIINALSKGRGE